MSALYLYMSVFWNSPSVHFPSFLPNKGYLDKYLQDIKSGLIWKRKCMDDQILKNSKFKMRYFSACKMTPILSTILTKYFWQSSYYLLLLSNYYFLPLFFSNNSLLKLSITVLACMTSPITWLFARNLFGISEPRESLDWSVSYHVSMSD